MSWVAGAVGLCAGVVAGWWLAVRHLLPQIDELERDIQTLERALDRVRPLSPDSAALGVLQRADLRRRGARA